jgi:hypothetical protein
MPLRGAGLAQRLDLFGVRAGRAEADQLHVQVQRTLAQRERGRTPVGRALFRDGQRVEDCRLRAPVRGEREPAGRLAVRVALDPRRIRRQVDERERLAVEHARVAVDAHRHCDRVGEVRVQRRRARDSLP